MTSPLPMVAGRALWAGYLDFERSTAGLCVLIGFVTEDDNNPDGLPLFPRPIPNRITRMMNVLEHNEMSLGRGLEELERGATYRNIVNFNNAENVLRGEQGTFTPKGLLIFFEDDKDFNYLHENLRMIVFNVMKYIGRDWRFAGQRVEWPYGVKMNQHKCLTYSGSDPRCDIRYWLNGESIARFGPKVFFKNKFQFFSKDHISTHHNDHKRFIDHCWKEQDRTCTWEDFKRFVVPLEYLRPELSDYHYAVAHVSSWNVHFLALCYHVELIVAFINQGNTKSDACAMAWNKYASENGYPLIHYP